VPALADLPALKYTASTIEETLRLYPPVWLFGRRAIADDVISGFHIPAGGALFLCPYLAHRDPRFWDNPEGFDPERFSTESAAAPRFSHFPFALGPRMCIGAAFATMEMQIVVAMVAARYRLQLLPAQRVEPDPQITLRPKNGLKMALHRRSGSAARLQ
jgi:cytochrome P450